MFLEKLLNKIKPKLKSVKVITEKTTKKSPATTPVSKLSKKAAAKKSSCSCNCGCKSAEDDIRDLINWIAVLKDEEIQDVTTRIEPKTAKVLTSKLQQLAKKVAYCKC